MYRRIRDLREDKDLYQKDLAEYLRCTQVCYSHYEMGKRDIPTDVLIKLADFYHTSTDYLLGRTDERNPTRRTAKCEERPPFGGLFICGRRIFLRYLTNCPVLL